MSKSKILLIDDNPIYRILTRHALSECDCDLFEADDGQTGLDMALKTIPDLIISDILMPTMDGYEFLRRLRSTPQAASTKVIFYTGTFSGLEEEALAKSGGVIALLKKPIPPAEMKRVVLDALQSPNQWNKNVEPGYEQKHLTILTNQLSSKVAELEKINTELRVEVEKRTSAEKQATQAKNFFQSLANSIPQMAWQALADGQLIYVNQRWQHFHKPNEGPYTLKNWAKSFHPDDEARVLDQFTVAFSQARDFQCEVRLLENRTQNYLPFWISAIAVSDLEHNTMSWFGTCTDISAQKNFERELTKLKENAEHLSKAKTEFLNNVSHEIRTPMNAILGFSEILKESYVNEPTVTLMAQRINANATRLMKILGDTISISELEAHGQKSSSEKFDVQKWINDLNDYAQALVTQKGLKLNFIATLNNITTCRSYPKIARSIFENILENAIKFTNAGQIEIRIDLQKLVLDSSTDAETNSIQNYMTFEIKDTGIGIDPSRLDLLFHPFSQSDSSLTRQYGGLGLGLLLSKKLADSIGGQLRLLYSYPGQGSCFAFSCPVLQAEEHHPALPISAMT